MNQISKQNRSWLQIYCKVARVFAGVILLVLGIIVVFRVMFYSFPWQQGVITTIFRFILLQALNFAPPIFALGVAQFITYVLEEQEQPGWMLRHLDKVLYLYAVLLIVHQVWFLKRTGQGFIGGLGPVVFVLYPLFPTIAIALVLVGLGLLLRRVLSIIKESKTLV